jgi:pimeloyl-ACP methyl ester carboxylesterase
MAKGIEEGPTVRPVAEVAPYQEVELHGHGVGYRCAGDGNQMLVLLHGITSTSEAWRRLMPRLAERYTVVAPDMIGHCRSAKPREAPPRRRPFPSPLTPSHPAARFGPPQAAA